MNSRNDKNMKQELQTSCTRWQQRWGGGVRRRISL